ncbi:MAG: glycoside hydrolase family 1 protein [Chloroflexia bacterium]|nr:glycoside hydrolase family 1 protein [Chloroflexia bacterium]
MNRDLAFPPGFQWGVAVAAHQVEGGNRNNDWWAWEQQPGRIHQGQRSGRACNWWEEAEADLDRAAGLHLNSLRLSVEWSRIEPQPGHFEQRALQRYQQILQGLQQRGLEPMVTLHHFSSPLWLAEQGGWENPETIDRFARFVGHTVEALKPHCRCWCTINEPNVYGYMGYLEGVFPPGKSDPAAGMRVIRHLLQGHAAAYRQIHDLQPEARVGLAHNMRILDPARPDAPLDRWAARLLDHVYNQAILNSLTSGRWSPPLGWGPVPGLAQTLDWIGLNYYTRDLVAFDPGQPLCVRRFHAEGAELLDGGYGEFYPLGLYRCLLRLAELGLPMYVSENGLPDDNDDQRPRYILAHLVQLWRAIQQGCAVRGYYHWTLADNFEWAEGWKLRFGLIELDPKSQERRPRPSAALYGQIATQNAVSVAQIERHAPGLSGETTLP